FVLLYLPLTIYVLHFGPRFFSLPHIGSPLDYLPFIIPMLIASAFFGMTVQLLVKEREMSLMVIVFTSIVFLFLSGLTWPRYAMSPFWTAVGDLVPGVWGMEGFIRINSNGATLAQNAHCYHMMWLLAAVYFVTATWVTAYQRNRALRLSLRR
ncbi:MAG: ABC transporter permease, partial [Muribaculaceae bacterium]|nr:ABC transporter permease [Muribaculaceae bacterium]